MYNFRCDIPIFQISLRLSKFRHLDLIYIHHFLQKYKSFSDKSNYNLTKLGGVIQYVDIQHFTNSIISAKIYFFTQKSRLSEKRK